MTNGDSTTGGTPEYGMVTVTVEEATFKAFLRHQEKFAVLVAAGVFDLQHGKATINFHEGHVQSVHVEERRYQHTGLAR